LHCITPFTILNFALQSTEAQAAAPFGRETRRRRFRETKNVSFEVEAGIAVILSARLQIERRAFNRVSGGMIYFRQYDFGHTTF